LKKLLILSAAFAVLTFTILSAVSVPAHSFSQSQQKLAAVSGRTVNAVTGQAVLGASVTIIQGFPMSSEQQSYGWHTVQSDAEGRFSFENVPIGHYRLRAGKDGFLLTLYGARNPTDSSGITVEVDAIRGPTNLEIRLFPLCAIEGQVVNGDREPVADAKLVVTAFGMYGNERWTNAAAATTNKRGEFSLKDLAPGAYCLRAVPPRPAAVEDGAAGSGTKIQLPTYFPSADNFAAAARLSLRPGQEMSGVKITVRSGPVYRIRGRIADPSSNVAISDLQLLLVPDEAGPRLPDDAYLGFTRWSGGTDKLRPDGTFELANLEPGSYHIVVLRPTTASGRPVILPASRTAVNVGGEDVKDFVLPLDGLVRLEGAMRLDGDEKASLEGSLVRMRGLYAGYQDGPGGRVGAGGHFAFDYLLPGRYAPLFSFSSDTPEGSRTLPGLYVKSVHDGTSEITDTGLDLSSSTTITVTLGKGTANVIGVVKRGDQPAPGCFLTLVPEPPGRGRALYAKTSQSEQSGRFTITEVAPGEYRLYAWDETLRDDVYLDPAFLRPFENQGVRVSVREPGLVRAEPKVVEPLAR